MFERPEARSQSCRARIDHGDLDAAAPWLNDFPRKAHFPIRQATLRYPATGQTELLNSASRKTRPPASRLAVAVALSVAVPFGFWEASMPIHTIWRVGMQERRRLAE